MDLHFYCSVFNVCKQTKSKAISMVAVHLVWKMGTAFPRDLRWNLIWWYLQIQRKLRLLLFSKTFQVTAFLLLKKNIDI